MYVYVCIYIYIFMYVYLSLYIYIYICIAVKQTIVIIVMFTIYKTQYPIVIIIILCFFLGGKPAGAGAIRPVLHCIRVSAEVTFGRGDLSVCLSGAS